MTARHLTLSAAVLLLLVAITALLRRGGDDSPVDRTATEPTVTALTKARVGSALARRHVRIEPVEPPDRDFDPYQEWSLERILNTFMVPPGQIEAATTEELIAQLEAIYTEYGGPGLDIALQASGELDPPININHDNISFDSLLKLIGIVAGQEVHIGESKITLTPLETNPSEEIVSSQHRVPASLLKRRPHVDDDPFSDPPAFDPKRAFEHYGIVLGDEVEIDVDHEKGTWAITGAPADVDRIESLVQLAFGEVPAQFAIEHKFFDVREGADVGLDLQTFATQAEASAFIQELVSSPDVTTRSHPRVVTRTGVRAMVATTVTLPVPTALDAGGNPSEFENRVLGMQLPVTASLAGLDRIHIDGVHETSELRDKTVRDDTGQITQVLGESDFVSAATDIQGQLFDQNTAVIPVQRADGTTTYQFLSVQRIDPNGQPIGLSR